MSDLISRQAAIDAMAELQGRASTKAELKGISKAWKRIKQLPSAQPEQRWIPCSERLPEENVPVLLGVKFKDDFKMVITTRMDYNYWHGIGRDIIGEMRWMPLPEQYKGI